ncbi:MULTISPECIES: hypothetical protein [unclassified Streptomyces]|uniref:hypothetical protein n=1 Tax=unclassified Streptomyces TaxID=2593676 RepID=UPI00380A9FA9
MTTRRSRRAERETLLAARRDSLLVLLSRVQRGTPLTADEGALLRTHVEAELRDSDQYRRTAGGAQAAAAQLRSRITAAEAAIVETEQRTEEAEGTVAALRAELRDVRLRRDDARAGRDDAERALDRERAGRREAEESATRFAGYLVAAQNACGAPNWPALPEAIRAGAGEATVERARYRMAWRSARRRALAAEAALAAELPFVEQAA